MEAKIDKATARPWTIACVNNLGTTHYTINEQMSPKDWQANKEFMVKAVNLHEELVEACDSLLLAINCNVDGVNGKDILNVQYIADETGTLKHLLAKARE